MVGRGGIIISALTVQFTNFHWILINVTDVWNISTVRQSFRPGRGEQIRMSKLCNMLIDLKIMQRKKMSGVWVDGKRWKDDSYF